MSCQHESRSALGHDLHETTVQAESNKRVVLVVLLHIHDNIEDKGSQSARQLDDMGKEHRPWSQGLGKILGDFDKRAQRGDEP